LGAVQIGIYNHTDYLIPLYLVPRDLLRYIPGEKAPQTFTGPFADFLNAQQTTKQRPMSARISDWDHRNQLQQQGLIEAVYGKK